MSREALIDIFTLDGEIKEWVPNDDSVELHGYVDYIEGTKTVMSNGKKTLLFKVTVNNGGSCRIKVCFWGEFAKKYSMEIQDRTVISIIRARTVIPKLKFNNPCDAVEEIELYILPSTTIKLHSDKFLDVLEEEPELVVFKIADVFDTNKLCYIEGYLKQEFAEITSFGGSFGTGLLVDDSHRIQLKVNRYDSTKKFIKGSHLRILGKIFQHQPAKSSSAAAPQYLIRSMEDVTLLSPEVIKSEKELKTMGFRTPKRKLQDDNANGNVIAKKGPFDD